MSSTKEILSSVIEVLARTLSIDPDDIDESDNSDSVEGWDSLNHENILLALNEEFATSIDTFEGESLHSIEDIVCLIESKMECDSVQPLQEQQPLAASADSQKSTPSAKPVVVISDSNARSFAYHSGFVPIMIASSQVINFLTPETIQKSFDRITDAISRIASDLPVIVLLPGTVLQHYRNTFKTQSAQDGPWNQSFLEACVENHVRLAETISNAGPSWVGVAGTPPLDLPNYHDFTIEYDALLSKRLADSNIPFIEYRDILIDSDGGLLPQFKTDMFHVTSQVSEVIADILIRKGVEVEANQDFSWHYDYRLSTETGTVSIWGDFPKADMSLESVEADYNRSGPEQTHSQVFHFQHYHRNTNSTLSAFYSALNFISSVGLSRGTPSAIVIDCKEGLLPLELRNISTATVTGVDKDERRITFAKILAKTFALSSNNFQHLDNYSRLPTLGDFDLAFVMERWDYTQPYLLNLFSTIYKMSNILVYRSALGSPHRKLIGDAGFSYVFEVPISDESGFISIPRQRPVRNRQWAERLDYHLLVATKEFPTNEQFHAASVYIRQLFDIASAAQSRLLAEFQQETLE